MLAFREQYKEKNFPLKTTESGVSRSINFLEAMALKSGLLNEAEKGTKDFHE